MVRSLCSPFHLCDPVSFTDGGGKHLNGDRYLSMNFFLLGSQGEEKQQIDKCCNDEPAQSLWHRQQNMGKTAVVVFFFSLALINQKGNELQKLLVHVAPSIRTRANS